MKREKKFSALKKEKNKFEKKNLSSNFNLRLLASQALKEVFFDKKKLKNVVDEIQKKLKKDNDRALLKEIVYGALRNIPFLDFAIENFINKEISETEPYLLSILRVGAYQIFFLERVPDYAIVNECVNAAKLLGFDKASKFINAVLRKMLQNKEKIFSLSYSKPFPYSLVYKYGMPLWIIKRYVERFGEEEAEEILESLNKEPLNSILFFSMNDYISLREELKDLQLEKNEYLDLTFCVKKGNPAENRAFKEGLFYICDPSSQLPALILPLLPNTFSLDLCAAPGTKTIIISKRLPQNFFLLSSDFSKDRLEKLKENKEKYSLKNVFITAGDLVNGLCFKEKFYSVLLDAPCSSMGTLKKNPEIRWQIDEDKIKKESEKQVKMLIKAGECVQMGGYLLYSVCSMEKEETLDVVENFLKENKQFEKEKINFEEKIKKKLTQIDKSMFLIKPNRFNGDSFFMALFRKKNG